MQFSISAVRLSAEENSTRALSLAVALDQCAAEDFLKCFLYLRIYRCTSRSHYSHFPSEALLHFFVDSFLYHWSLCLVGDHLPQGCFNVINEPVEEPGDGDENCDLSCSCVVSEFENIST